MSSLQYNHDSRRFTVGEHELHCGEVIQVKSNGTWIETRIEHNSNGWYFVHVSPNDPWRWINHEARLA